MTTQLQLNVFRAAPEDYNVRELERILSDSACWLSASAIGSKTGWNSDKVNNLARVSADIISGQHGYKHLSHSSTAEVNHFLNGLSSRAHELESRRLRVQKRAHALVS